MTTLRKQKIKKSLIDDFIQISLISNFYFSLRNNNIANSYLSNDDARLLEFLKQSYLEIIKDLKLNDNSFMLLVCELNKNNQLFEKEQKSNFQNLGKTIDQTKKVLITISNELDVKLKLLKLN